MDSVGTITYDARINLSDLKDDSKRADGLAKDTGDSLDKNIGKGARNAESSLVSLGVKLVGVVTAFLALGSATASAVARVDTLNNSERVFQNMGFAADSTSRAMTELEKSIKGLPTPLDSAVRGVQVLSGTIGDVEKSQQVFSALNNAIIGFGGTAFEVEGAINQLSQLPLDGPLDAATWNSLRDNGLTPVFAALAKESGVSVGALKEAFGSGELTVQDFNDRLIKLNKEGGGGLASLEKIARDSTSGIGTGFANLQTAVARGIAAIIESVGSENISNAISSIGTSFEGVLKVISAGVKFLSDNKDIFIPIAVGVGAIVTAIVAFNTVMRIATAVQAAFNIVMGANPIGLVILAVTGLIVALAYFFTQTETGKRTVEVVFGAIGAIISGVGSVAYGTANNIFNFFSDAVNNIKNVFTSLVGFFAGLWNTIVGLFGNVGTAVGNAIGGAFKNVVNSIVGGAVGIVNGFIDSINAVISVIDAIPGVDIAKIGKLPVPQLSKGGIVTSPTLAMIGEGQESEAVIPLSKLDDMLDGNTVRSNGVQVTVNMNGIMSRSKSDERDIARNLIKRLNEDLRAKGYEPIGGGAL